MQKLSDNIVEIEDLKVELMSVDGIVTAVRGVDLKVMRGRIHGIVGESGCGKSVMTKSIMRLHDEKKTAYSGKIFFDGEEITGLKEKRLRELRGKDIAMIFQNPMTSLSPIMKIGEQISEAILAKSDISKEEAKTKTLEILEMVGITPAADRYEMYPFELSGGLLQRVMIAMAMVNEPRLLIADEPTTALDVTIQAQILNLMKKMQKDTGVTIIFITHDLGVIAEMCDTVSVMYAGKVVETASVMELFDKPAHPYTKALLDSMPKGSDTRDRLTTIQGAPPSLSMNIKGCSFAPRCKYACDKCKSEEPKMTKLDVRHTSTCLFAAELYKKGEIAIGN
ncbi:MAG: ABC transporter ATP-binding protein [Lachnospiraceae bacterium]|nr:ABC transporter ATP-binding protein [Lachnospiraceae bacterium]